MADIWLISDTHFNHEDILNFKDKDGNIIRKFYDVHDMNETMIDRWNKLIKSQDKVYHLGDVYFGSQQSAKEILSRLNGHKRLIVGNHDTIYGKGNPLQEFFKKIYMWRMMPEHGILMSHVPVHPSTLGEKRFGKEMYNIHGHTHQNGSPEGKYISVCVELRDYMPIHIETLKKEIQDKT